MLYIVARVTRTEDGDLEFDPMTVRRGTTLDGLMEVVAEKDGDMVGIWDYGAPEKLTTRQAREWADLSLPDRLYIRSSWGEMVRTDPHYRTQMGS